MRANAMLALPLIALGIAIAPASSRAANLITNGSFEDPVLANAGVMNLATGSTTMTGWTVVGPTNPAAGLLLQTNASESYLGRTVHFNSQDGLNAYDVTGSGNAGSTAGITQTINTVANEQYTISFYVGRVTPDTGPGGFYSNEAIVDLSIDGGPRMSFTNSDTTLGYVNWKLFSHTFTATGAATVISFLNGTPIAGTAPYDPDTNYAGLDNVVVEAVPEPASMAMLASGALALAAVRIARRRSA